jgi:hypothetical protein
VVQVILGFSGGLHGLSCAVLFYDYISSRFLGEKPTTHIF